ncbi:MAG: uracil-DNA glycosylase [Oceanococcus sp.]
MSYSAAHLSELGLSLWRLRSDLEAQAPLAPSEAEVQSLVAESLAQAQSAAVSAKPVAPLEVQQLQQDDAERDEAKALRLELIAGMDWDALEAHVKGQSRAGAQQAVFGAGARGAQVMVIGHAPGVDEDKQGQAFVGAAGQLLDQMLLAIGLNRKKNAYLAHLCKFRPPNNGDPRANDLEEDFPYLLRQIELVQPKLIIAVGRIAAQHLLSSAEPIGRMRSKQYEFGSSNIATLVTYHPDYLIRSPREKSKAWQDLKLARSVLINVD